MKHIIIIGGGIIGLSSALYLQQKGYQVTVLDKDNFMDNCSYGNAGYVCPSHFIPLAAPGIVKQGLKWMLNSKSPFYVQPSFNKALIDWGWQFMKKANAKHVAASGVPLRDIALLSQQEYASWTRLPGFDFAYEHKGLLEIFKTPAAAEHARHTVEQAHALGLDASILDHAAMQALEPQTRIDALGAIFFKCDAHLYPNKLMHILLQYLIEKGVKLMGNNAVQQFETSGGQVKKVITDKDTYEADAVVLATGSWSRELAAQLSIRLPMMPGRGYSITLEDAPYQLQHPAILVEGRTAVTPMDGNKIRFGGTMEVVPVHTPPRYQRVAGILKAAKDFFPDFDIAMPPTEKIWYGFRPCSADGLPFIGKARRYNNLVIATGHSMLGLSLGAGTGKLVSELVHEEKTSIPLEAFAVERFG